MNNIKFDYNDITIYPSDEISLISSRKEINIEYNPLIVSPMDTVINKENYNFYLSHNLNICIPRNEDITNLADIYTGYKFISLSLDEAIELINNKDLYIHKYQNKYLTYFLIDIANGHMQKLVDVIKEFKLKYPNSTLMVGNIANPKTFKILSEAGADFIRCGIGAGNACTTSANGGIHYPMASLINECYEIARTMDKPAKIVADGGIRTYSDIIKALALGADYVMIGSLFNKMIESCGDNYFLNIKINQKLAEFLFKKFKFKIYKKFRGMSTKEVQRKWKKQNLTTSEGVVKKQLVEYSLEKWLDNFFAYLKTNMSYCGKNKLSNFIGKVNFCFISENAYKRFNK